MTSAELRKKFINFFSKRDHQELPPSSLVPENDPSVLFTTAGMQQFKRYYTHPEQAPAKNMVTCQPCLRTSDIEVIGDESHLTFFEMMGNFSFGGYFKKEAIEMAYWFLTKELGIEAVKISCSVFAGDKDNPRDDESAKILSEMGLKFAEHGREDNFWGPTGSEGPCGPTVEFYIGDVEVWNLVFNEYYFKRSEKQGSATAGSYFKDGKYEPLRTKGVDTGLGLERMLAVLGGLKDVYQTDVFWPIIEKIEELSGEKYKDNQKSFRIIADHLKGAAFLLSQEIVPDKIGRGYITRRLIRRSIIQSKKLKIDANLPEIVKAILKIYPEIKESILSEFEKELAKFNQTLERGLKEFEKAKSIDGETAFQLFETYGFPIELTEEIAKEKNIKINRQEFEKARKKHQEISRAGVTGFKGGLVGESVITTRMHTATHLLLKALQEVLGPEVHQRGSNINRERIRFDFSYPKPMTEEEIKKVEEIVNEKIKEDIPVERKETTVEEAKKLGAEAQFIDKYSQYGKLTMYSVGDFSHELCGGPHVKRTGEIGKFKIKKEESSSAGVRRIRAIVE